MSKELKEYIKYVILLLIEDDNQSVKFKGFRATQIWKARRGEQ